MNSSIFVLSKFVKKDGSAFYVTGIFVTGDKFVVNGSNSVRFISVSKEVYDKICVSTPSKAFIYPLVCDGINQYGYPNFNIKL